LAEAPDLSRADACSCPIPVILPNANPGVHVIEGKQSMKDCVIIENYLQLIKRARTDGFTQKSVFLTSNTDDYRKGTTLHPDLSGDFQRLALTFAINYSHARFSI
jgi:hypothetical protein